MLEYLKYHQGIPSICSSHPVVLREVLRNKKRKVLIETTCNQVNQFGGYSGMTPEQFTAFVRGIAAEVDFPSENLILGGDHLGPSVWQNEPSNIAMQKSIEMVQAYVQAGYTKIHLDCSMKLEGDPTGLLDTQTIAQRAARLVHAAEKEQIKKVGGQPLYVIGTDVPVPGGAGKQEEEVQVTRVSDVQKTIELHQKAFLDIGLDQAWERVIAVVVQPGVEFGDDFVLVCKPDAAHELSSFIETQGLVYEAHSTDYQSLAALQYLVRNHFAILKVGPNLTFAYREAIFSLALIENELFADGERSTIIDILDKIMIQHPDNWQKYYEGTPLQQAFKRKYSFSDRIRYYWNEPEVQTARIRLMKNLSGIKLPTSILSQFAPREMALLIEKGEPLTPDNIISMRISRVLENYWIACE